MVNGFPESGKETRLAHGILFGRYAKQCKKPQKNKNNEIGHARLACRGLSVRMFKLRIVKRAFLRLVYLLMFFQLLCVGIIVNASVRDMGNRVYHHTNDISENNILTRDFYISDSDSLSTPLAVANSSLRSISDFTKWLPSNGIRKVISSDLDFNKRNSAEISKSKRGLFYANFWFALIGVVLIAMASVGLGWGFYNQLQLQRLREKSQQEISRLMNEIDLAHAKKNQIITTMSHDIRQPLQTLAYLTAGVAEGESKNPEVLRQIHTVTTNVNSLVNALYNLSKFDNELVLPDVAIVNVEHILRDISQSYYSLVTSNGIQLHINHKNAWLKTDANLLKHAIGLLVENAIKHSSASHIWVESSINDEGRAEIRVRDNGKGIPQEEWPKMFDEFYQTEASQRKRKVGMGLGLSLFARIADLLDIRFHVAHPHVGALHETMICGPGIEFVIEMPELALAEDVHSQSLKNFEEKRRRRSLFESRFENNVNVWVVDSNHSTASAVSQMMQQWGVTPHVFTDFYDVKSGMARLQTPDLVLTTENVTGVDSGEALIDNIRVHYQNELEACVMSDLTIEASLLRDDIHFLVNPISPNTIFDILYNVVEYKRNVARKKREVKKRQNIESSI